MTVSSRKLARTEGLDPLVEKLVRTRQEKGITQVVMARRLGISPRTLQDWERGRRQPKGPGKALLKKVLCRGQRGSGV